MGLGRRLLVFDFPALAAHHGQRRGSRRGQDHDQDQRKDQGASLPVTPPIIRYASHQSIRFMKNTAVWVRAVSGVDRPKRDRSLAPVSLSSSPRNSFNGGTVMSDVSRFAR
jgi:hypothetical protein